MHYWIWRQYVVCFISKTTYVLIGSTNKKKVRGNPPAKVSMGIAFILCTTLTEHTEQLLESFINQKVGLIECLTSTFVQIYLEGISSS